MAGSILQCLFAGSANGTVIVTESKAITISSGNHIAIFATATSSQTLTLTLTAGAGTITAGDTVTDTVSHQQSKSAWMVNPGTGGQTVQASVPGGTTNAYIEINVDEVAGCVTASPVVAHGPGNYQGGPGTGTDAITSGTAQTPSAYNAFVVGYCLTDDVTATPLAGTGYTSAGTGMHWELGVDGCRIESKAGVTSGTVQATFTSGTGAGSDNYCTLMIVFQETGSAVSNIGKDTTRQLLEGFYPHLRMSPTVARRALSRSNNESRNTKAHAHLPVANRLHGLYGCDRRRRDQPQHEPDAKAHRDSIGAIDGAW